jgi:hypothetical protein
VDWISPSFIGDPLAVPPGKVKRPTVTFPDDVTFPPDVDWLPLGELPVVEDDEEFVLLEELHPAANSPRPTRTTAKDRLIREIPLLRG